MPQKLRLRELEVKLLSGDYDRKYNEFLFRKFENILHEMDNTKLKKNMLQNGDRIRLYENEF